MPTKCRNFILKPVAAALCGAMISMGAAAASGDAKVVSRVDPEFPREALQAGAAKGRVKARMTVARNGEVVRVEILDAEPRRVFDRAVVKTLALWRFDTGSDGRAVEIDVEFRR
ncbi:MAG TPA: TonB family protein [Usitatibacter sp.]|nr:TonB family protein [Usitatibacter sp.]